MKRSKTAQYYATHPRAKAKKLEYDTEYQSSEEQKKNRASRNAAARRMPRKPGYDIDHVVPLSRGGTNSRRNLRLVRSSVNRAKGNRTK